jgi:hypothetical protein
VQVTRARRARMSDAVVSDEKRAVIVDDLNGDGVMRPLAGAEAARVG